MAAAIAQAVLPGFAYYPEAVAVVVEAVLATRVPQRPLSPLAEALCDADLYVLGTSRFDERQHALRDELEVLGTVHSDEQWIRLQIAFMEAHRYFTKAAQERNGATKQANLAALKASLAG